MSTPSLVMPRVAEPGRVRGIRPAAEADAATAAGPRFDLAVAPNGYVWWYVDALSDDGRHGLTIIAFIGSVFSPYYAWARRWRAVDPLDHCALNVALYGDGGHRWAMTERGVRSVSRTRSRFEIGPSSVAWDGRAFTVAIDERMAPVPRPMRGTVRVVPSALTGRSFVLDAAGRHRWSPLGPCARIEVDLESPRLRWSGEAYLDSNDGDEPLEAGFTRWDWSRACVHDGTAVLYDTVRRDGSTGAPLAVWFDRGGRAHEFEPPPRAALARSGWRVARATRCEPEGTASVVDTLEDGPFYARSTVASRLLDAPVLAMHESLSLTRFASPWVQWMLPFRMPRRA